MNILFLNKFNDHWKEKFYSLKKEFPGVEFTATFNPDERAAALRKADAVVSGRLSKEEIESSPNLKAIIVPFTGLNNFPVDTINEKKIAVYNTHANAPTVAEHAVAIALALLGRIVMFHDDLKRGKWSRSIEADDMWVTLQKKAVGIVGLGSIGKHIAKYLEPFGCKVIGFKKNPEKMLPEGVNEISTDLNYVINNSKIIFVCLPLSDDTKDIINKDILMKMKGKYLINVGRGTTVNEEALYNSLKDGILAGAALDVWYKYPGKSNEPVMPANFPFHELTNVLFSPHKSSHTPEAVNAMIDDTIENVRKVILTG